MPDRPHSQPPIEDRTDGPGKRRLHISVPSPMARMNLGMPWFQRLRGTRYEDPRNIPRFGYKGISLQTDSYLFIDIHKDALISVEKSMQLQTGKEWLQYSSGSTWLATEMDATVATQDRLTLVAGAGQGHRRHIDHGLALSLDAYNNLHLHYRVDSVMMGVYEFMTGRRERVPSWETLPSELHSGKDRLPRPPERWADRGDQGMYQTLEEAEKLLGPGLPQLEGLLGAFEKDPDDGWYGYGKRYFTSFDPYEMKSPSVPNDVAKALIAMKNAVTLSRRVMDVALHVGTALDNLPLLRQAGQLANAASKASDFFGRADSIAAQFEDYPPSNAEGVRHRGESGRDFIPDSGEREFLEAIRATENSPRRATLTLSPPPFTSPTVRSPAPARAWLLPPVGVIAGWIRTETQPLASAPQFTIRIDNLDGEEAVPLTAQDLATAIRSVAGTQVSVSTNNDNVTIVSNRESEDGRYFSYLSLGGQLFELLTGGTQTDAVPRNPAANASDDIGNASDVMATFSRLFGSVASPDNAGVKVCKDLMGCFSDTVKALDELGSIVGDAFTAPSPPSMIGLFARDGITLGTTDRVVSAAGKGYLFFADGGTGSRDHHKFSSDLERPIGESSDGGGGGIGDFGTDQDTDIGAEIPGTNGFTVLSNSSASILTRSSLDLFALGTEPRGGGEEIVGRGVARLGATRSVEVAAHRQVVIAATGRSQNHHRQVPPVTRSKWAGDELSLPPGGDSNGAREVHHVPEGGEVSILGEAIRLGCVRGSHVVQPVSTTLAWPSDNNALNNELHQFAFERTVGAPTEQVEVQATGRIDLLSHPYSLRVAPGGILLSGQPAKHDRGSTELPRSGDAIDRLSMQAARSWSEAKYGAESLLAYATRMYNAAREAHDTLNTDTMWQRTWGGLSFKEWKALMYHYQALMEQAQRECEQLGDGPEDYIGGRTVDYGDVPVLRMTSDEIILGFVDANGRLKCHIRIEPDGCTTRAGDSTCVQVTEGCVSTTCGNFVQRCNSDGSTSG